MSDKQPKLASLRSILDRLCVSERRNSHRLASGAAESPGIWFGVGVLFLVMLAIQMAAAAAMAVHDQPGVDPACAPIERVVRNVMRGWLMRHMERTGASAVNLHASRALLYGACRKVCELALALGCIILVPARTGPPGRLVLASMMRWVVRGGASCVPLALHNAAAPSRLRSRADALIIRALAGGAHDGARMT